MEAIGTLFDERMIVGLGCHVHGSHAGSEPIETQRDDWADKAHHLHDQREAVAIFELYRRPTVVVVRGHGAHASHAVANVANDIAAFSAKSA